MHNGHLNSNEADLPAYFLFLMPPSLVLVKSVGSTQPKQEAYMVLNNFASRIKIQMHMVMLVCIHERALVICCMQVK